MRLMSPHHFRRTVATTRHAASSIVTHACTCLTAYASPSFPPSLARFSPETKAATASALTLRPLSLNARKMARLAAAVVEDDMHALCVRGGGWVCMSVNVQVSCPFCAGDARQVRAKAAFCGPSRFFSFPNAFVLVERADLSIPTARTRRFSPVKVMVVLAYFMML